MDQDKANCNVGRLIIRWLVLCSSHSMTVHLLLTTVSKKPVKSQCRRQGGTKFEEDLTYPCRRNVRQVSRVAFLPSI